MKDKIGVGIGVMILRDGKVLLGRRHENYEKADSRLDGAETWTMPGGSIEYGESFEEAGKRETEEETGIKLNDLKIMCVNNDVGSRAHFITVGLFSGDFDGEPKVMEEAITEWRWFSIDDLPEKLFFPSKKILENYREKKFYIKNEHSKTL